MTPAEGMTTAATAFLESLNGGQRDLASLPFDANVERSTWYYFPNDQAGLALRAMDHWQQKLAHRLLLSGLSLQAYSRACHIMTLDNTLDVLENFADPEFRDMSRYFVTIFGEPSQDGSWGWRFQGHHISVNYTIADGQVVASTPLFLGANPARMQHEGYDYSRPLGDAEDIARELLHSLDASSREAAMLGPRAPVDLVLANLPYADMPGLSVERFYLPAEATFRGLRDEMGERDRDLRASLAIQASRPAGLPGSRLSAGQRDQLARLVSHYSARFPEGVAWQGISELDELHFAWAGGTEPGERHYYRLHGPNLLVEYDNSQDNANHAHTVCRHPRNDFAANLLGMHYRRDHRESK